MVVHIVGAPEKGITESKTVLISSLIKGWGHELAHDWTLSTSRLGLQQTVSAISRSDVVVIEASDNGFGLGYLTSTAELQRKPVLLLVSRAAGNKPRLGELENFYIKPAVYDDDTLETVLKSFLDDNDIPIKDMRFNFYIDRAIYQYLRNTALATGKTKAEILRELVLREIEKGR
jgi:hypothetical protein